jgi:hypothetical protein
MGFLTGGLSKGIVGVGQGHGGAKSVTKAQSLVHDQPDTLQTRHLGQPEPQHPHTKRRPQAIAQFRSPHVQRQQPLHENRREGHQGAARANQGHMLQ